MSNLDRPADIGSRVGHLVTADVVIICLAVIAVALRLISRFTVKAGLWWDDYAIVFALPLALALPILNLVGEYTVFQGRAAPSTVHS